MRRLAAALMALAAMVLGGCWDMADVDDRLCVRAVALDAGEAGRLAVSFSLQLPDGKGEGSSGARYRCRRVEAATVTEAVTLLRQSSDREVHFDHLCAVLLGAQLVLERGLEPAEPLWQDAALRPRALAAAVNGEAGALLDSPLAEGAVGELVQRLILSSGGRAADLTSLYVAEAAGEGVQLPILHHTPGELQPDGTEGEGTLAVLGAALFSGKGYAGALTAREYALLMAVKGGRPTLTVKLGERVYALEQGRGSITPAEGGWQLALAGRWSLQEGQGEPGDREALEAELARRLTLLAARCAPGDGLGLRRLTRQQGHRGDALSVSVSVEMGE